MYLNRELEVEVEEGKIEILKELREEFFVLGEEMIHDLQKYEDYVEITYGNGMKYKGDY